MTRRAVVQKWILYSLCALALVLGTVRVTHPAEGGVALRYDFALRACAADETVNGRLAFLPGEGRSENGTTYTGCLFRLEGENIETVTLQVEAGGLYRDGAFTDLGRSLTEDYDPEARYGFCLPEGEDLSAFDGTALTVAVTFSDGTERSQSYPLQQEQMLACAAAYGELPREGLHWEGVQALTAEEGREEAQYVLERLNGRELELPVYFDWEPISAEDSRTNGYDYANLTDSAVAFCQTIQAAGYQAGVYINRQQGYYHYDLSRLADYSLWVADYNSYPDFYYRFDMWQYSANGQVDGFDIQVDQNLLFVPKNAAE